MRPGWRAAGPGGNSRSRSRRTASRSCEVIDAADPDGRAVIVASEFASCKPDGMPTGDFLSAAMRVANELWQDEPPATWQRGKTLLAEGHDRHDVIHLLAEARYGCSAPETYGRG